MVSADGRYTIVHNGEIYNFLELADELAARGAVFRTESDTEVILAAYAAWGVDFLERLNGIWAFAIWDTLENRLLLARDRFGVKPLYVAEGNGMLAFASEIKALATLSWVRRDPLPAVIRDYLIDGTVDRGTATFFRDIDRFPAAHGLELERDQRRWHRYWSSPPLSTDASMRRGADDDALIEGIRARLIDAVRLQLRSDVPIGSCLSGGIDSSSIVSIAARLRSPGGDVSPGIHRERDGFPQLAFFAEFADRGIDERPYVDAVVAATGVELRTTSPDGARFLEALGGVMDAQDEPFGSLSIVAQYEVMRIARGAGVKVLLDGQGADELLGGYLHYPGIRLAGALRRGSARDRLDAARALISAGGPYVSTIGRAVVGGRTLPRILRRGRMPDGWYGPALRDQAEVELEPTPRPATMLASRLWRDLVSDNLPGLLRYEDRNSMAFGIEARVPFLDHRLAEASLALPDRLRVAGPGARKVALVRAMRGIVPELVLARTDKVAFQPPQDKWLREARPMWADLAVGSHAEREGLLGRGVILEALQTFERKRVSGNVLWRVLNLEMWLRRLGSG
jgi:asparagine synthase (glutamine-hydrolysing)